jgi:hypothetical protein
MSSGSRLEVKFVEYIPDDLEEETLYISIPYTTAAHKCACGCGEEVVTPLSPTGWKLIFDGETVSLDPSIGNWSLPCESHYWIRQNQIQWGEHWGRDRIEATREARRAERTQRYGSHAAEDDSEVTVDSRTGVFRRLWSWLVSRIRS